MSLHARGEHFDTQLPTTYQIKPPDRSGPCLSMRSMHVGSKQMRGTCYTQLDLCLAGYDPRANPVDNTTYPHWCNWASNDTGSGFYGSCRLTPLLGSVKGDSKALTLYDSSSTVTLPAYVTSVLDDETDRRNVSSKIVTLYTADDQAQQISHFLEGGSVPPVAALNQSTAQQSVRLDRSTTSGSVQVPTATRSAPSVITPSQTSMTISSTGGGSGYKCKTRVLIVALILALLWSARIA